MNFIEINSINFKDELLFQSNYSLRFFNSYFTVGLVANDINCLNKYENDINEQQKKGIISSLKRGISFYNEEEMDAYYLTLKKLLGDDNSFQKIKTKYEQINSLKKGNPSPTFNYPDSSGKSVSLASLSGKLVYVDVWATWCGPCKQIAPKIEELSKNEQYSEVSFYVYDIDDDDEITEEYIEVIPTFLFFKDGELVDKVTGADYKGVVKKLDEMLEESSSSDEEGSE